MAPQAIRIPAADENIPAANTSPRAALVAGLRCATERRVQQQREQYQAQAYSSPNQFYISPPVSPPVAPGSHSARSSVSSINGAFSGSPAFGGIGLSPSSGSLSSLANQQQQQQQHQQQQQQQQHQQQQQQQHSYQPQPQQNQSQQMHSQSPGTSSMGQGDLYNMLYAKQQELLATSMLITQQQQRLQTALNQAAAANNSTSSPSPYSSYLHPDSLDQLSSSLNNLDLEPPPPAGLYTHHSPFHSNRSSGDYSNYSINRGQSPTPNITSQSPGSQLFSFGNDFYNYNRPTTPNLPVRPSSSASTRRSLLFANNTGSSNPGAIGTASPSSSSNAALASTVGYDQQQSSPGGGGAFRRGHRKANSLSSTMGSGSSFPGSIGSYGGVMGSPSSTNTSYASHNRMPSSNLSGPPGLNSPGKKFIAPIDYEVPARQPYGPPPLEDLRFRGRELNFATARVGYAR